MKLGTGLITCQRRPDDDRSTTERYDEMVEIATATERAGLDSAWVSEHHFSEDGYLSGAMPSLGAIAQATDRIEIGTYILIAPLHDPVRLAEDAATVDLLSDGRSTLGLAIGYREEEFDAFGVPLDERAARITDTSKLLRGAWSAGPIGYDSAFHPVPADATVTPKPEGGPKLLLGGMAKPAVRRGARLADGWAADAAGTSLEGLRKRLDDIRRVRDEEGLDDDFDVYVAVTGFVGDSPDDAWERIEEGYLHMRRTYDEWFGVEEGIDDSPERIQQIKDGAILGEPEQVTAELEAYGEALGEDVHVIFKTYYPGIGTDTMVECLERLGDDVVPHL